MVESSELRSGIQDNNIFSTRCFGTGLFRKNGFGAQLFRFEGVQELGVVLTANQFPTVKLCSNFFVSLQFLVGKPKINTEEVRKKVKIEKL